MADRKICYHILLLELKALETLDRLAHHLSYQGNPKSTPHIFFVLTNLVCFDLGTSLPEQKYVLSQGSDVSYIGHWLREIYLCDRQTDRQTHRQTDRQTDRQTYRQTDRQTYFAALGLADLISLSVVELSPNCQ